MSILAKSLDVTCYDATYLALAEELDFEFITADEKLRRKVSKKMKGKTVIRLLAELQGGGGEQKHKIVLGVRA